MSLIDDAPEGVNTPEFSVSEISGAVKRMVEGEFGHVRVRGEVGRVSRPRSGHVYLDLKDDRAVLAGVMWKGVASRLTTQPEEGMEVVATGRLTTFPGQSKYQIVIEKIAPAGVGALMAMLEKRKAQFSAEGLFASDRKRPIPFLPRVIGVVTSPSGAVIRDILHRLSERFPMRVLVWPVAVQGTKCAPEVAAAINGFGQLRADMRPDLLIVARGGGSVEDLWGFNEEPVIRAAAGSSIPLISAVGHETDTTLIDLASDLRAPTPTAAAELAVPVRADLLATVADLEARRLQARALLHDRAQQRLSDLGRALPRPERMLEERRQRLDVAIARMPRIFDVLDRYRDRTAKMGDRLPNSLRTAAARGQISLSQQAGRLTPARLTDRIDRCSERLADRSSNLMRSLQILTERNRAKFDRRTARFVPALVTRKFHEQSDHVASLGRTLRTLDHNDILKRGFAILRSSGDVVTTVASVRPGGVLEIELKDGQIAATAGGRPAKPVKTKGAKPSPEGQGSLF